MASLAEPAAVMVDPLEPMPFRVVRTTADTSDVTTLVLEPVGATLSLPLPGQFVMIWAPGVGEIPISVSRTGDGGELVLTVRSVGAVSAAVTGAQPGGVVGLRGPFGTAWPVASAAGLDVVVVAGGLGLAPLRLAIDALSAAGPAAPARLSIVVGSRRPDQLIYSDDMRRWADAGAHVHTTVDAADRSWHGAVGTATALLERLDEPHDLAFVCGPELMMTSAARAVIARGVDAGEVWVSLERNMHCGIAHCGRCQLGPLLLCRDGAVVCWDRVAELLEVRGR